MPNMYMCIGVSHYRKIIMRDVAFIFTLPAIEPQVPDIYHPATNKGDRNTCNTRTIYIRTSRRAYSYPSGSARFVAYRGNCPRPVALNTDQFAEIVRRTVPCPAPSPGSRTYVAEDRLPTVAEILLLF